MNSVNFMSYILVIHHHVVLHVKALVIYSKIRCKSLLFMLGRISHTTLNIQIT
jgi:hypothetical protein